MEHLEAAQDRNQELSTQVYLLQIQVQDKDQELECAQANQRALERNIRETAKLEAELLQDNLLKAWELEELRHKR